MSTVQLSIPFCMYKFLVLEAIPKARPIHYAQRLPSLYAHLVGSLGFRSVAPIDLQARDAIWVDLRNGNVEIVERDDIAIWRASWVN